MKPLGCSLLRCFLASGHVSGHVSGLALALGRPATVTTAQVALEFGADIHGPQRMKACDSRLNFPLLTPYGWHGLFLVRCPEGLVFIFVQTFTACWV